MTSFFQTLRSLLHSFAHFGLLPFLLIGLFCACSAPPKHLEAPNQSATTPTPDDGQREQQKPAQTAESSQAPLQRPTQFAEPSEEQQLLLADGIGLFSRGENELAVVTLIALARTPEPSMTRLLGVLALAQLYVSEDDRARALATLKKYRDHFPVEENYQAMLAALYELNAEPQAAITELESLAEHIPAVPEVLAKLVYLYHQQAQFTQRDDAARRYEVHLQALLERLAEPDLSKQDALSLIQRMVSIQDERLLGSYLAFIASDDLEIVGTVVEELVNYADPSYAKAIIDKAIEAEQREEIRNGLSQAAAYLQSAAPNDSALKMPFEP